MDWLLRELGSPAVAMALVVLCGVLPFCVVAVVPLKNEPPGSLVRHEVEGVGGLTPTFFGVHVIRNE